MSLDQIERIVGHGSPGGKDLLTAQRRYVETLVAAVEAHADAMRHLLPTDSLLFLMDLSIEPTLAALRQDR